MNITTHGNSRRASSLPRAAFDLTAEVRVKDTRGTRIDFLKRPEIPLTTFAREEYARQIGWRSGEAPLVRADSTSDAVLRRLVLLARGREEENLFPSIRGPGGAGDFFRERGIVWWSTTKNNDRPSGHLASSQISCVNFLLPLAAGPPDALVALLQAIDHDVVDILPIEHEGRRSLVELEWVGVTGPLEPGAFVRGAGCTSVDALLLESDCGREHPGLLPRMEVH